MLGPVQVRFGAERTTLTIATPPLQKHYRFHRGLPLKRHVRLPSFDIRMPTLLVKK